VKLQTVISDEADYCYIFFSSTLSVLCLCKCLKANDCCEKEK
jgi:hypothetical protein